MKLNYIAGGIVYNLIAVWWVATIWMNWDAMPPAQRTMGAPSILLLTYPAQMYMIWTFRQMARRFAKRAREVEAEARAGAAAPGAPRAGAVAAAKEGPLARRRPPTGPSAAPPDKVQVARGGAPGVDMP